ncbi:Nb-arc domain-containing disease resistance protein [Thalictrum thalictroides]|uniref:Nb-arc domain-containing disease resistance protein n=1 Tax=Thalictrum thalictroides TaxID=46969 RepID=A0A7J6VEW9_THATH|nr:Nb-arc domain-containing disease resistance protein [Thalictrum thalictroides]
MYSIVKKYLPKPKLSGQSFIDVYKRGEGAPVLSGLSDNCNSEIKKLAEEVMEKLLDPTDGIIINFYRLVERPKFEGRIILKYAATKLMEQNHIDVLILARVADGNIDLQKFQMQLAQKLGIIHENEDNDDGDDPDYLDDVLARQIHASLEKRNLLFVSECYLDRKTLRRVGIPSVRHEYFLKLVFVTESRVNSEFNVPLEAITNASCWDLACAQVHEYTHSQWSTTSGREGNKPIRDMFDTNNIIQCIANFPWFYYSTRGWKLFWFADILFSTVIECPNNLNVNTRLKLLDALLYDLYELGLAFDERFIPGFYQRWFHSAFVEQNQKVTNFVDFDKIVVVYSLISKESWRHLITTPKFPKLSTLEITNISSLPPNILEDFFKKTEKLRLLSIYDSECSSLPRSITCLVETLKYLSLRLCRNLDPDSLSCIQALKKLEILQLSDTRFEYLPDDTFQGLERLQVLDLSKNRNLKSLPSSVSCLQNLEHFLLEDCDQLSVLPSFVLLMPKLQLLNLKSCTKLRNVTPSFRHVSKSLIELDISNCTSLENFKEVSSSVGDTLPCLEVLHCSKVKLGKLFSLKGCPNLNTLTLGGNKNVEVLDISGTQLNKLHIEESLPDLKRINIVGTKCLLRAVDWKLIKWLPQEVNWNEFGEENRSEFRVYIAVSSDIVFKTLESTSQLWEEHFSQFHICLFPSNERGKEKRMFVPRGRTHYNDIYMRTKSPSFPYYDRFLECAGGGNRFPKYVSNVLSYTQFLSLYDDRTIKRLSDLQVEKMAELKECWIEKCYSMETVFDLKPSDLAKPKPILGCLENLRISQVMKATNMCIIPGSLKRGSFGCLKHMHLEYCPNLLNVFTSGLCLENLEVVEIKFCARLQEVFSGKGYNVEGSFSKLHTLCFIELPVLTSIIEDVVYMPSLTKIKVKGCPKLRMLPLRCTTSNCASSSKHPVPLNVTSVVVSGEPDWWGGLQWADKNVKEHISFKSWPLLKFPRQA